jgi:Flp pilus assembly protein TadD
MRIVLQDRVVDLANGLVQGGSRLTQFECTLLRYLREHAEQAMSRDRLLVDVWGYPRPVPTRCVETAVRRVREKIEQDQAKPRHLLTIRGEGYRWWDGGAAPVSDDDRCGGRQTWSERLAWAETTFGEALDPHDPRVGLTETIRAAYVLDIATLGEDERALLELLSLCRDGWAPGELARHADLRALRSLVHNGWVVVRHTGLQLGPLWWPVRGAGEPARTRAAELWIDRLSQGTPVDLLEVLEAHAWPELSPDQAARLVAAARSRAMSSGFALPLLHAADAILRRSPRERLQGKLHMVRGVALWRIGLTAEARRSADSALEVASGVPEVEGEAAALAGVLAQVLGDFEVAERRYRRSIELNGAWAPTVRTDLARVHWALGRTEEALRGCKASHAAAMLNGQERPQRHAARALAWMMVGVGQHAEAISRLTTLYAGDLNLVDRDGGPFHACTVAMRLGLAFLDLADLHKAEPWLARAFGHARDGAAGHNLWAKVHSAQGIAAALEGDWNEANALQLRAVAIHEDSQVTQDAVTPYCFAALGLHRVEDAQGVQAMLRALAPLLGAQVSMPNRALVAATHSALGVAGSAMPKAGHLAIYVRLAQRALAGPVGPFMPPEDAA